MLTLHAIPLTCSFAVHLMLVAYQQPFTLCWAARGPARQAVGEALVAVNPKRKVPALVLPDGEVLTEMVGVLLYIDETWGPARPPAERRRLVEWLSFVSTELHKGILAPTFDPDSPAAAVEDGRTRLLPHALELCDAALAGRSSLLGGEPGVADAYLWWALLLIGYRWPEALPEGLRAWRRAMGAHGRWGEILAAERARFAGA